MGFEWHEQCLGDVPDSELLEDSTGFVVGCSFGTALGYCKEDPEGAPQGWFKGKCCETCQRDWPHGLHSIKEDFKRRGLCAKNGNDAEEALAKWQIAAGTAPENIIQCKTAKDMGWCSDDAWTDTPLAYAGLNADGFTFFMCCSTCQEV